MKFGERGKKLCWIVGALLVLGWLASGALASWFLVSRRSSDAREVPPSWASDGRSVSRFEEVRLATRDGEELGAWFVAPGGDVRRRGTVIFLHGNSGRRTFTNRHAGATRDHGYSVLSVSLRAHGDSTGDRNDFGWSARADILAAVDYLEERLPGEPVAIVGTSLGSAAAIFAASELGERVRAYWLNSPYHDLESAAWDRCERMFPAVLEHLAYYGLRLWTPLFFDTAIEDIRPIDHVGRFPSGSRVVFAVGDRDLDAPPEDVALLEAACSGQSRFVLYENVGHEGLEMRDFERYMAELFAFLDPAME